MIHESVDGFVLRTDDYKDNNRYLSVLTADKGRITLLAKGSRSLKGEQMAISQPFVYGNFEYYKRGDFNILKGGVCHRSFHGVSEDLTKYYLACYLCELMLEMTDEGEEAYELFRLTLNAMHALEKDLFPLSLIKGAVELRAAALSGYTPDLSGCAFCGKHNADPFYLHVMNGQLICADCLKRIGTHRYAHSDEEVRAAETIVMLSPAVTAAVRYCIDAPLNRLFLFSLEDSTDLTAFARLAQTYILSHLGRGFHSLAFYESLDTPC
ncbi:MAG: DNA repair protein RecO [Clostridia bacterium]|nr:DNA repair protein RecO [Clostridia bacterium]